MDIKNYIASGMIEGYLFGLATEEERVEFEKRLKVEPELQKEFDLAQERFLLYSKNFEKKLPSNLEEDLWEKLNATKREPEETHINIMEVAENMVVKEASSIVRLMPFVVAASLALFSISAYMAYHYRHEWQASQERSLELESAYNKMQATIDEQKAAQAKTEKLLNIFNQNGIQMVKLSGKESLSLMVCWNRKTGEVMVHNMVMPDLPAGKVYQLWAMKDGKPVSAGIISMKAKDEMMTTDESIDKASSFAVTIEDGEADEPNMDQMVISGNI